MKYKKAPFALCGLILLIGFVIFLMMGGFASRQDPPEPNPTSQRDPSVEPSRSIVDSGLSKDDIPVPAPSDQVTKWLLPSQVAGRMFPKVDLGVLATRLPKEKLAVFERMRLEFPEVDWTEIEQTHQAFLTKRAQLPLNLNDKQREAYAAWLAEVEPVSRALIELRVKEQGLSSGGMEGNRGFYIDGFRNGVPVYVVTANVGAANTTGASYVRWNPGTPAFDPALGATINGEGVYVNVNDHGEIYEHTEFQLPDAGGSRIMVKEVPGYVGGDRNHMTHVTGTVAAWGYNSTLQGMAPRSWVRSLIQMNTSHISTYGMATPGQQMAETNPRTGNLQLRSVAGNTSLGTTDPYNRYNSESASYDSIIRDYPYYMHFNSAGNDGTAGYESLTGAWKISKNMITIGNVSAATRDANGIFTGGATIASNSSRGPTYDGRVTPDFVAKGTYVTSTLDTTGSATWSGTSMASPNATGSVALLMDYVRQRLPQQYLRSSTYRALLMATADDLGNPGPDYTYGWGILNIHAAARIIRRQAENPTLGLMIEDSLAPSQTWTETYGSDGTKPIQVAIAWLDPASTNTDPASRASRVVNDLDLVLIGPGGTEYKPYVMPFTTGQGATPAYDASLYNANAVQGDNTTDAVEQVYIAAPAAGTYTVRVTHKGNLLGNQDQPFSVAVSGADELPVSMEVARSGSTIDTGGADGVIGTSVGTGTQLIYTITNVGGGQLALTTPVTISGQQKCSVTVNTQPSSTVAKNASTNLVATVTPNATGTWSFNISIPNNDPEKSSYHWHVTGVTAASSTTSFTAAADTFIDNQNTGTNYGTETRIDLNNRTSGQNQSVRRGLIRFDISSIPPGTTIESAKLDFVQDNAISGSVDIFEATASWLETPVVSPPNTGATWSNSSALYGATSFGTATTGTTAGAAVPTITLNATGLSKVQNWVNNSSTNYGLGITTTNNGSGQANWLALRSREHADHPRLTLTYAGGIAQAPLMIVSGSDGVITSGGTDTISSSQQSLGTPLTYSIRNLGNANLTMTTPVSASSTTNCTVTFNTQPSNLVSPSGTTELLLTVTPSGAGAWSTTVSIPSNDTDKNPYTWTISGTAAKIPATLTLNGLNQTYDGTPRIVTATTSPAGLAHSITYNGGSSAPINGGSYAVVATITDPNYEGSASGTLVISYTVSYQGNGSTYGTLPSDQTKFHNVDLTLATNSGNLSKAGYTFAGWNTQADGSGTPYAAGATYSGNAPLVLHAQWTPGSDGTWIQTDVGPFDWGTSGNWSNGNFADGANHTAFFTSNITANQTVNLESARTIGNITFTDSTTVSHNLTISGANALTLSRSSGTPVIDVTQSGRSLTISSQISGSNGLLKSGAGTLSLSGTNTYSGGTTFNGGTVIITADAHLGSGSGTLTFNGGTLSIAGPVASHLVSAARDVVVNSGGATFTQNDNGIFETTGVLSGSGTITNTGGSASSGRTLKFMSTANTFTGDIDLTNRGVNVVVGSLGDAGKIIANSSSNASSFTLNSSGSTATTFNTRVFEMRNNTNGNLSINNDSASSSATLIIGSNLLVTSTNARTLTLGGANTGNNTFSGLVADGSSSAVVSLVKSGLGTWRLSANNTYTGQTHIQSGTLSVSSLPVLGNDSPLGKGSILIIGSGGNTGTLLYTGGLQSTDRTIQINNATNNNTGGATIINDGNGALTFTAATFNPAYANTNTATRTLTLGGTNGGIIEGVIQNISGTILVGMTKTGTGTWTLSGANTYTGATTVQQGNLVAGSNNAFGNATSEVVLGVAAGNNDAGILIGGAYAVGRNIRIPTSATTDTGTRVLTLGGSTAANSEFSGNIILGSTNNAGRGVTLTAATGGQVTFSGVIQNPTSMDATAYTVTKSGEGTVVFTNANTYTGNTTVSAGKLFINGDQPSATGNVTVSSGATLGGNGAVGGNVTINANGKLEFSISTPAASHNPLNLASAKALTFSGASVLTITSPSGASPGVYKLVTGGSITGSAPATLNLPQDWVASVSIVNNELVLNVTSIGIQSTYESWSNGTFANSFTDTALTSNPDGDSMSNLMEFAFGTDPTLSSEGTLAIDGSKNGSPTLIKNGGNFDYYFVRRKDHGTSGSVSYTAQFSNNLTSFTNSADTPIWVANCASDPTHYEVVKVPFPNGTRFGRVEIKEVP